MSLVAWYPLNGNLNNLMDATNPLINSNETYTKIYEYGKMGQTYQCTSNSRGSLVSAKKIALGQCQSMFAWVYVDDAFYSGSSLNAIMGQHRFQHNMGMGLTIKYDSATSGRVSVNTGNGSSRTYNKYTGHTRLTVNQWYHLGYTYDGHTITLYVNGLQDGSHIVDDMKIVDDYFGAFMWSFVGNTESRNPYSGYIGKGKINDIRLYNHTVSPIEAREIAQACILHYTFNDPYVEPTENLVNRLYTGGQTTIKNNGFITSGQNADTYFRLGLKYNLIQGHTYTISCDAKISSGYFTFGLAGQSSAEPHMVIKDGHNEYTFICTEKISTKNPLLFDDMHRELVPCEFYNFQIEEKNHSTPYTKDTRKSSLIYDSSGYNYNATIINNNFSVDTDTNHGSYALHTKAKTDSSSSNFDKVSYIKTDMGSLLTLEEFSVELNLRVDQWGYQTSGILSFSTNEYNPLDYTNSTLVHYDSKFVINRENKDNLRITFNTNDAPIGQWNHFILRYKNNTFDLFKNGIKIKTVSSATFNIVKPFRYIYLGYNAAGGARRTCSESWSNFKIYATALSSEEILDLYQTKAYISNRQELITSEFVEADNMELDKKGIFIAQEFQELSANPNNNADVTYITEVTINANNDITAAELIEN